MQQKVVVGMAKGEGFMQGLGPELHVLIKALMGGYFHSILET